MDYAKEEDLIGKTIISIDGMVKDSEEIIFTTKCGKKYKMYHHQDCCEYVYLEDVNGNVENLLNSEILRADVKTECEDDEYGSITYTFYTFATIKGYVDLRWNGSSNGYYSESVDFELIGDDNE